MTTLYHAGPIRDGVTSWSSSATYAREYLAPDGFYTGVGFGGDEWHEIVVPDDAKVLDLRTDLRRGLSDAGVSIGEFRSVPNMLHDLLREQALKLRAAGYDFVAFVDGGAEHDEWLDLRGITAP